MIFAHNTIYIASQNRHKHKEISAIFKNNKLEPPLLSPKQIEVEEYGKTFEENSLIKAMIFGKTLQKTVLADDSGLIIDALPNDLGIYSARYKENLSQTEKNLDIIKRLKNLPREKRTARFISVVTLYNPITNTFIGAKGIFEGYIATAISGTGGFGYDPIFIPSTYQTSVAELSDNIKNKISHRARAIENLLNTYQKL